MRIRLWGEQFWPSIGGAELFEAGLIASLRERGYDFTVVTWQIPRELPASDVYRETSVHRFPFREALDPPCIDRLIELRRGSTRRCAPRRPMRFSSMASRQAPSSAAPPPRRPECHCSFG